MRISKEPEERKQEILETAMPLCLSPPLSEHCMKKKSAHSGKDNL